jgi:mannose-6-phosphate isomerase-like protein (cupin superfamily)
MQATETQDGRLSGVNFVHVHAGAPASWKDSRFEHPRLGTVSGKSFLQERLGLTGMEVSLSTLPPGAGLPFLHRHNRHEELYLFLSGRGQFQVDGVTFEVEAGSAVRVAPKGERAHRNTGKEPLVFIVVQAPADGCAASSTTDGAAVAQPLVWQT